MAVAAGSRVAAIALAAAAAVLAVPSAASADDPTLTLTPVSSGTDIYGGVGTPMRDAAPYTVTGGSGHVVWAYQGLPDGLAASQTTGVVTGTPTLSGSYPLTISVTDGDGQTQSADATLLVDPIGLSTASGQPAYLVAIAKDPVSAQAVIASGDSEDLTWSATGLPPGLSIDKDSGVVSGTPTQVGAFTTRFKAVNTVGNTAYLSVLFEVVVGYTCDYHETGAVGQALSINCGVFWSPKPNAGGRWLRLPGRLSYSAKGLPSGLRIDPATGVISGSPRNAGTATATVSVKVRPDGVLVTRATTWRSSVRCAIR